MKRIAVIGGGAAGFFSAVTAAQSDPTAKITLFEQGKHCLKKVKISGGGRCNVTHACFDPEKLAAHYPRGARELRPAFHRWQPLDTIAWFEAHGVTLKREKDGRMFPITDDSQTIIDCLSGAARRNGVKLRKECGLVGIEKNNEGSFLLYLKDGSSEPFDRVCIAGGSLKNSPLTKAIEQLGHTIEPLCPSLFAFNLTDSRLTGLSGLSVPNAKVHVLPDGLSQSGPLLITHRGLSGPAILRTSAWEARTLNKRDYRFEIRIQWDADKGSDAYKGEFSEFRKFSAKKAIKNSPPEGMPRRLWEQLTLAAGINEQTNWGHLSKTSENKLLEQLTSGRFTVNGKTTNKEEFVTAGGISLKEIDFRRMESRIVKGLYFAGECLDIDGITGGFNFQAAWTTGYLAGQAMGS